LPTAATGTSPSRSGRKWRLKRPAPSSPIPLLFACMPNRFHHRTAVHRGASQLIAAVVLIAVVLVASLLYWTYFSRLVLSAREVRVSIDYAELRQPAPKRPGGPGIAVLRLRVSNTGNAHVWIAVKLSGHALIGGWHAAFYEVTSSDGRFGRLLGYASFEQLSFRMDWGSGEVYAGYSDRVGYIAYAIVNFTSSQVTVSVESRDGIQVYIDGEPVFSNTWRLGDVRASETVSVEPGLHTVVIAWFHWAGYAKSVVSISGAEWPRLDLDPGESVELTIPLPPVFRPGEKYLITVEARGSSDTYVAHVEVVCKTR